MVARDEKGRWLKGTSGNPSGTRNVAKLWEAVEKFRNNRGQNWFQAIVELSTKEPTVARALLDKFAPTLSTTENVSTRYKIVVETKDEEHGYDNTSDQTEELAAVNTGQSI